ncbi:hypothetical protein BB934_29995 (plasmid) [Microvirga ossetica]|uniref:DUF6894 domain-containing protein n=1 Tax=Microvirga ossetica TaxID=1882682 RepID=A0A1B2ERC0_9HYPH|nr:hypothetical protein [Microvirga ossetica]ANY82517.1 hypothetical protein BB934_29995 [Microvirga ossetica]
MTILDDGTKKAVRRALGIRPTSPRPAPTHATQPALHYFNIKTPSGVIEDPEGDTYPGLQAARADALAKARDMIADGDQKGEDRHDSSFEIRDCANQHVLTVAFSEIAKSKLTSQGGRR